jgi:hypothetical protein
MKQRGRIGCGCLTLIVIALIAVAISLHPATLRFVGKRFEYADKAVSAQAIVVPFFVEDRQGELHSEAIREFFSGSAKKIFVEDAPIFRTRIYKLFLLMAKERGVKERDTEAIETEGDLAQRMLRIEAFLYKRGVRTALLLCPSYASLRLHVLTKERERVRFFIRPCPVSYFEKQTWWKDPLSRSLLVKEASAICAHYLQRFKYGAKREEGKG